MGIRSGFDRETCVKEVLHTCAVIRRKRGDARQATRKERRRAIASKLRQLRAYAWLYFRELPEVGGAGCCRSPWKFASVRVKR
jgi:hypothetical protein